MITIVDYGMGNIGSVKNALLHLGADVLISNSAKDIEESSHIILPGVGSFGDGMKKLEELGLVKVLKEAVLGRGKLFLGICLGMQLLAESGEEGGLHKGLGWLKGKVRKFQVNEEVFRVPHIGWDDVRPDSQAVLFSGISPTTFYFVHSFFLVPEEKDVIAAICDYGEEFPAAIQKKNIFGVQFHPEKSQKSGLKLIKNFIQLSEK